jgi:hypothetical protein
MNDYVCNGTCPCARCRARGLMGAAVLITLGVLFLIGEFTYLRFGETFPALLIVIGLVLYMGRSASTEGHVQPPQAIVPVPPPPPVASDQPGPEVNR